MELSRQEYPALVAYLQPNEASTAVTDRLKAITRLNTDIADWLQERRKLEEAYVLGLRKLARRQQPEAGPALGIFELPWNRLTASTETLAQSHETLAQHIETDVERPLREYAAKNSDMQAMASIQHDLLGLVRDLDAAQKRAAKSKGKPGKSAAAAAAVEEAKAQWESRAPFVFEKLQDVDEHRVNHLRDVLTQFQTHEADQVERNRQTVEGCLNVLLNLNSADEIKIFAARVSDGRSLEPASRAVSRDQPSVRASPSSEVLPPLPTIQPQTTGLSTTSPPSLGRPSMASSEYQRDHHKHTGFGGGLKRLGTVMGRRRSIALPSGSAGTGEKKFRFGGFRKNDSSRSFQQLDNPQGPENGLAPVISEERPRSRGRETQTVPETENTQPVKTNGATPQETTAVQEEVPSPIPVISEPKPKEPQQADVEEHSTRPDTVDDITLAQQEAAAEEPAINLTIRDKPIKEDEGQAKQAMSEVANTLRLQAQHTGISRGVGTLRGRRDVRNTIFIPNPASPDLPTAQGLSPAVSPGPVSLPPLPEPQPKSISLTDAQPRDEHPISDNASVQSSHTLHSLSGPISHPELHSPGISCSIVEKLSVLISGGAVTRSYVVGELAMAYNPDGTSEIPETQVIRLENFHILERVAANPQFVSESQSAPQPQESERPSTSHSQEKKGEYTVSLSSITGSMPNVAFKYQIHLDTLNLASYTPVIFTPVWNEEEFQASVIITYAINPKFVSSQPVTSMTLKNLALTVNLDLNPTDETTKEPREVARASGAVMHPNTGALFRRKTSAVVWKIPELVVNANGDGKFLARFTSSTSWPRKGKVEAKFDFAAADNSLRLGVTSYLPPSPDEPDPFSDASTASLSPPTPAARTWKELPAERKLSVARYVSS